MLDALDDLGSDGSPNDDAADSEPADPPKQLVDRSVEEYHGALRENEEPTICADKRKPQPDAPPFDSEGNYHRVRPSRFDDGLLAPPSVDCERLPDPFVTCGCEEWQFGHHDPEEGNMTTAETCPNPRPVRRGTAREQYRRIVTHNDASLGDDGEDTDGFRTSKLQQARGRFARIRDGDVAVRARMDGVTTVLLTLRQSPVDAAGRVITPWTLTERVFENVGAVMNAARYQLDKFGFDYQWVRVVSGTERWATPHVHILWYVDDPNNSVDAAMFESALTKHVERNRGASWETHGIDDATAVRVEHDPPVADDKYGTPDVDGLRGIAPTQGAIYLATQLPHFALRGDTEPWAVDRAVSAWASARQWFRVSRGWPDRDSVDQFKN